jgi:hypothetical protein
MEQEPAVESFEDQINYPMAFVGAIAGAAIGVAMWAGAAYLSDSFYYITPIIIGVLAAKGATSFGRKGHISIAILGLIVGTIGIIVGDFAETAAFAKSFDFSIDDYISIAQFKIEDDIFRGIVYVVGIAAAFLSGFSDPKENTK